MRTTLFYTALMMTLSAEAFASGDGGSLMTNHAINLAILLTLIVIAARKPIMEGLSNRADQITKEIEAARQALESAQALHDKYEGMISGLEAERETLRAEYRAQGERERADLIEEGKREADRLTADAQRAAENELAALTRKVESELIDLAMEKAEALLKSDIKSQDQQRLAQDYIKQLEELGA